MASTPAPTKSQLYAKFVFDAFDAAGVVAEIEAAIPRVLGDAVLIDAEVESETTPRTTSSFNSVAAWGEALRAIAGTPANISARVDWSKSFSVRLEREEGEEQIAAFLAAHPEFARAPLTADDVFGHSEWITPDGDLRTLPFQREGGMDGFFAARIRKSEAS